MNTEEQYNLYKNTIKIIAFSFYNTTGLDFDDLIAQANLIFCEAIKKYNPERGTLKTYMNCAIRNGLRDYIYYEYNKANKINKTIAEIEVQENKVNQEQLLIAKQLFSENKNPVIRYIYKLLISENDSKGKVKQWLTQQLINNNFKWDQIRNSFKQIKQLLKEV